MEEAINQTEGKKNTGMAIVAYILFFIPLLVDSAKDDPFVKFHVKQGLVFFLACAATGIFIMVPVIGWLAALPMYIFLTICWIIGILNAIQGKERELPLIGKYAQKINL
jgi:uncharacterized membrane protein